MILFFFSSLFPFTSIFLLHLDEPTTGLDRYVAFFWDPLHIHTHIHKHTHTHAKLKNKYKQNQCVLFRFYCVNLFVSVYVSLLSNYLVIYVNDNMYRVLLIHFICWFVCLCVCFFFFFTVNLLCIRVFIYVSVYLFFNFYLFIYLLILR